MAINRGLRLVTRNTKDFDPARHAFVQIPYPSLNVIDMGLHESNKGSASFSGENGWHSIHR